MEEAKKYIEIINGVEVAMDRKEYEEYRNATNNPIREDELVDLV